MKIVTLSTYPVENARHGGQHRLRNIVRLLRDAGHTVIPLGVAGSEQYPPSAGFLPRPMATDLAAYTSNPVMTDDWALGKLVAEDDAYFSRLAALVPPDVELFHVEQPWLFPFARRYAAERKTRPPLLLYGSANVEHELKRRIVEGFLGKSEAEKCAKLVLECELEALQHADLACAVSHGDAAWMRANTHVDVLLAANGTYDIKAPLHSLRRASEIVGNRRYCFYSASSHPPNIVGFYEMFGRGVGCLAPDERIVIAGGAGHSIRGNERFDKTPGLASHYVAPGEVDDDTLAALLQLAHLMLLPITQGGGTNLKTAEAIWSGHHIVATPVAMRGFEQFSTAPGVAVAADPIEYRAAVRDAMARPLLMLSADDREQRRSVLWERTLAALVARVGELAA